MGLCGKVGWWSNYAPAVKACAAGWVNWCQNGVGWMFIGAFNNNKGKLFGGLIALSARTTASMLFLTWLSKLLDMNNKYHDDNVGFADYAKSAISFIIFGIWFKMLVVPLVADNRS